jgi:hypothetical protein
MQRECKSVKFLLAQNFHFPSTQWAKDSAPQAKILSSLELSVKCSAQAQLLSPSFTEIGDQMRSQDENTLNMVTTKQSFRSFQKPFGLPCLECNQEKKQYIEGRQLMQLHIR